jgi:hypothetical protein
LSLTTATLGMPARRAARAFGVQRPATAAQTQISILGVATRLIESVSATGSSTGRHTGRLLSYSGDRGASFVSSQPFAQSEQVTAIVRIRGLAPRRFSFSIARLGPVQPVLSIAKLQPPKLDHFVSEPGLLPPRITVLTRADGLSGDIFLTPLPSPVVQPESNNAITIMPVGPGGPMIVDGRGRLVWFRQLTAPPTRSTNTWSRPS